MRLRLRAAVAALLVAPFALLAMPVALLAMPVATGATPALPGAGRSVAIPSFYLPPATLPAGHGTLIRQQPFLPELGTSKLIAVGWRMLYTSTDALGAQKVASASLLVPLAPWTGGGARPIVNYAPGSHGLGASCAPSIQLAAGTEYEAANLIAALQHGYAVIMTDYQGATTGGKPLYLIGAAGAHDVLDAQTAAMRIPFTGLSPQARTAFWGYSQGSQAVTWAATIYKAYAPGINVIGIATGGVPADLLTSAEYLESRVGAGDVLMAIVGLNNQYPAAILLNSRANAKGKAELPILQSKCVFPSILDYQGTKLSNYTKGGQTLAQLATIPAVAAVIKAQNVTGSKIPVPVFQFHGLADEFVPVSVGYKLARQYCAAGVADQYSSYPGEHLATQFQAFGAALDWFGDRLGGTPAPSSCQYKGLAPVSTANPGGGDFVVSLDRWVLSGTLHLNSLNGDITLPPGGAFTGATDLTSKQLQRGKVTIPVFTTTLQAYGFVPLVVTVGLVQQGLAGGTASLDSAGMLHVATSVSLTIQLQQVNFQGISLTESGCATESPVSFALEYDGPLSSLGNGNLAFSGSATFPNLGNCGLLTGVLNQLFPGPGNTFSFTVAPPAPVVL